MSSRMTSLHEAPLSPPAQTPAGPERNGKPPEPGPGKLLRLVKRMHPRERIDSSLDRLRFALDTFPRNERLDHSAAVYQPLPWVGLDFGTRAEATTSRWEAIEAYLDRIDGKPETALDIGCSNGFFTVALAHRGLVSVGVERHPPAYRTALYAAARSGAGDAGFLVLEVTPRTVAMLPEADVVLLLSLWHHFVHLHGLEAATAMLETIWARTRATLFFESGEREMPPEWGLPPLEPDPRTWFERLLGETCPGGRVVHLGVHGTTDPRGRRTGRNLFAVTRLS